MSNLRSLFRREIAKKEQLRVFTQTGQEDLGVILDISQKGFRLDSKKTFSPGTRVSGLIEVASNDGPPSFVPFNAQCVWTHKKEAGFTIKEIPRTAEAAYDKLIEEFSGPA